MKKPLISVITACYNCEKTLKKALESVYNQEYSNIEYILIDGGSTDNTVNIIKNYEKKFLNKGYNYKWISEPDNGIFDAFNKGLKLATGDWIGIIGADDWYEKDAFNIFYKKLTSLNEKIDIFYGMIRLTLNNECYRIQGTHYNYLHKHMIEHPACFIKREAYKKIGNFDCKYKSASDYDFMLRGKKLESKFYFYEKVLTNFEMGGTSSGVKGRIETLDIQYKYGILSKKKKIIKKIDQYIKYYVIKVLKNVIAE